MCVLNAHNLLGDVQQIDRYVLQTATSSQFATNCTLCHCSKFLDQEACLIQLVGSI